MSSCLIWVFPIRRLQVLKSLRQWTSAPIIIISARGQEKDKIAGLDAGADDYLTKPFGIAELKARLRVAVRHIERSPRIRRRYMNMKG